MKRKENHRNNIQTDTGQRDKSVIRWTKEWGRYGYFDFVEQLIGALVEVDEEMVFAVTLKGKD